VSIHHHDSAPLGPVLVDYGLQLLLGGTLESAVESQL
jgi:hypothetical protein